MTINAFGVEHGDLSKSDARFNPEANTKSPLYLPKHSPEAATVRQAGRLKRANPAGVAIRNGIRATKIAKRSQS